MQDSSVFFPEQEYFKSHTQMQLMEGNDDELCPGTPAAQTRGLPSGAIIIMCV